MFPTHENVLRCAAWRAPSHLSPRPEKGLGRKEGAKAPITFTMALQEALMSFQGLADGKQPREPGHRRIHLPAL